MAEIEEPLAGGNASDEVVRVGNTVRKPWLASTPSVHRFMDYLLAHGVTDLPRPLSKDSLGRQVTEFVPGVLALDVLPLSLDVLRQLGRQIRQIHDVASNFEPTTSDSWTALIPAPEGDKVLICHNDLAPWNLIMGERQVFIDWDGAGPSTRLWDLAYAAQSFAALVAGEDPEDAALRLRALVVEGYMADADLCSRLPKTMGDRTQAMYDLLHNAHRDSFQPWAEMFLSGHGQHWQDATKFVRKHQLLWAISLRT